MKEPKISIIVPCYNQAQYLGEALQSVLDQTEKDWECIIVNDGSPDDTAQVALDWVKRDERFIYIFKENAGLSAARNTGIEKAKSKLILPLDADDRIGTEYISRTLEAFRIKPDLTLVYCRAKKFGIEEGIWNLSDFSLFNLSRNNLIFPSGIYKKDDWKKVGGYDPKMIYGWEDWEFWISLLKNGRKDKRLDYTGFYYRIKNESMLKSIDSEKEKYLLEYLSIKHVRFFVRFYGSFKSLELEMNRNKADFERKIKNKKFILKLFIKTFTGVSLQRIKKKKK